MNLLNIKYSTKLDYFIVNKIELTGVTTAGLVYAVLAGGGSPAFRSDCLLAAKSAVAVNDVCGTRRGINGTRRLPSTSQLELTS